MIQRIQRYILKSFIIFFAFLLFSCQKEAKAKTEVKLTPMNGEQIFNKYQDAVVLIKHSFVYKVTIDGNDFYFKNFDKNTGTISDFISYDEAKENPNVSWGTGFFIDNQGTLLTNKHVVDVRPTEEEQKMILIGFKEKFEQFFTVSLNDYKQKLNYLSYLQNSNSGYNDYSSDSTASGYEMQSLREELITTESDLRSFRNYLDNFDMQKNSVTKTSIQFGVFFNNQKSSSLNDYVQYKSIKISENPEVDLTIMKPVNPGELTGRKIVSADMSKIDSAIIKPLRITEKVTMLGYNYGAAIGNTSGGMKPQLTEGNISQVTDENKILYTIPALPGSSGSPVFDKFGRLVAVNFAGMTGTQSFNYGIQTQQIARFIK